VQRTSSQNDWSEVISLFRDVHGKLEVGFAPQSVRKGDMALLFGANGNRPHALGGGYNSKTSAISAC